MTKEAEFIELARLRQLDFFSPHLTVVDISSQKRNEKRITDWLWSNTNGRFWIGSQEIDKELKFIVGFEIPYEATFFSLKFLSEVGAK